MWCITTSGSHSVDAVEIVDSGIIDVVVTDLVFLGMVFVAHVVEVVVVAE